MITSAISSAPGYTPIPAAVRDYYSQEVFFLAQPRLRFLQFTKVRRDLQAVKGKRIVFTKYDNLSGGGSLSESDVMVPEALVASEVIIPVTEHGNAVQVTELLLVTSLHDVMGDTSRSLAMNMAKVLDSQLRDAALSTTNIIFGNGATSLATLTAPAPGDVGSVLNARTVRDAVEVLAANDAPKIDGEYYVCFATPHQLRALREDPEWQEAHKYMGRRNLYLGEVGMYEGVIFIETTQMPKLTPAQTTAKYGGGYVLGVNTYEAVFFGENTLAWGIALDVELRDDGVVDLGRKHTIGWYGIWGTGLLEEKYAVRALTL